MSYGPLEILVVKFPGNHFTGEIAPALEALVDTGTIRVIDFLFVSKDANGEIMVAELDALGETVVQTFGPIITEVAGLLSEDDALQFAQDLEPNTSEALLLFENTWAARFAEAVLNANGEVMLNERIPRAVIDELEAAALGGG